MGSQVIMVLAAAGLASANPAVAPEVRSADSFPAAHLSGASGHALIPAGRCRVAPSVAGSQLVHGKRAVVFTGCGNLTEIGAGAVGGGVLLHGGSALGVLGAGVGAGGAIGGTIAAFTSTGSKSPG